jgi:hypothetical protein
MTTISQQELAKALQSEYRHTSIADNAWDAIARLSAELLGVELADPKPEPGIYFTKHGDVLIVNTSRGNNYPDTLWMIGHGGANEVHQVNVEQPNHTMGPLTPARVVPTEEWRPAFDILTELDKLGVAEADRDAVLAQAARLAAHGITNEQLNEAVQRHYATPAAPVLPDSEQVWNAIVDSPRSDGARLTATQATDAVMALLERINS